MRANIDENNNFNRFDPISHVSSHFRFDQLRTHKVPDALGSSVNTMIFFVQIPPPGAINSKKEVKIRNRKTAFLGCFGCFWLLYILEFGGKPHFPTKIRLLCPTEIVHFHSFKLTRGQDPDLVGLLYRSVYDWEGPLRLGV